MSAEELASNQSATESVPEPVARGIARWASSSHLAPSALGTIALGFGVIAAVWLTVASVRAAMIAFGALLAAFATGRAARLMASHAEAVTEWSLAVCATLAELAVYAGIASSAIVNRPAAGMTGPLGSGLLHHTFLASFGGPGAGGVWRLAVVAAIMLAALQLADVCLAAGQSTGTSPRGFQVFVASPGGARLPLIGVVFLLAGARAAFLLLIVLGAVGFCVMLARGGGGSEAGPGWLPACRGDGPLAAWVGRFVGGGSRRCRRCSSGCSSRACWPGSACRTWRASCCSPRSRRCCSPRSRPGIRTTAAATGLSRRCLRRANACLSRRPGSRAGSGRR